MSESPHPVTAFLPFGLFLVIILGTVVAPGLGVFLGVLIPAPLILLYLQHGKTVGMASVAFVLVSLGLMLGVDAAMGFAAGYALVVILLAEGIRFNLPPGKTIGVAAMAAAMLSGVLLWMALSGEEQSPIQVFQSQLAASAEEYIKTMKSAGTPAEELAFMKDVADRYTPFMARSIFGILAVGSLVSAALNFAVVRALWLKFYPPVYFYNSELSEWVLPDGVIWGFIVSGAALFLGDGALKLVGLNVFIVMLALYCFQGMSIALHILKTKRAHPVITFVVFLMITTQPLMTGLVIGLGLFDVWIDFRKLRAVEPPPEDPDEYEE